MRLGAHFFVATRFRFHHTARSATRTNFVLVLRLYFLQTFRLVACAPRSPCRVLFFFVLVACHNAQLPNTYLRPTGSAVRNKRKNTTHAFWFSSCLAPESFGESVARVRTFTCEMSCFRRQDGQHSAYETTMF